MIDEKIRHEYLSSPSRWNAAITVLEQIAKESLGDGDCSGYVTLPIMKSDVTISDNMLCHTVLGLQSILSNG